MRNIFQLYQLYQYICRKQLGVYSTIPEFNQNMDAGLLDAIEKWFSEYGVTQKIHDAIKPLREYQPFTSDSAGFVTYPSNYLHLIGTPFTVFGSSVTNGKFVQETEFAFALTSQLRGIDGDNPVYVDSSTGFSIYPQTTQTGAYWYLRRAASPTLVVTQVGRTITYDPVNSIQVELLENYWNNVLAHALKYQGVSMDENGVYQFAIEYQKETE